MSLRYQQPTHSSFLKDKRWDKGEYACRCSRPHVDTACSSAQSTPSMRRATDMPQLKQNSTKSPSTGRATRRFSDTKPRTWAREHTPGEHPLAVGDTRGRVSQPKARKSDMEHYEEIDLNDDNGDSKEQGQTENGQTLGGHHGSWNQMEHVADRELQSSPILDPEEPS